MIRILQANLHRSKTADNLLHQLTSEYNTDIVIISEQYKNKDIPAWSSDPTGTSAIWIRQPKGFQSKNHGSRPGLVWMNYGDVTIFSCYLTPNESIQDFRKKIDTLEDELINTPGNVIIAGDFNAKAVEWGMNYPDSRGKYIMEMVSRLGLLVLNTGSTSTFRRPGQRGTIPDVSFASENVSAKIKTWRVIQDYTGSDHQYIHFEISKTSECHSDKQKKLSKWNTDKLNEQRFIEVLARRIPEDNCQNIIEKTEAESLVNSVMRLITQACEAAMPRKTTRHSKRPVYWWTPEIANVRRLCLKARRAAQRASNDEDIAKKSAEYKKTKKLLRHAINLSKIHCWKRLTDDINRDPWGQGFKIVSKKIGNISPSNDLSASTMTKVVQSLFPTHQERPKGEFGKISECPLFSDDELQLAIKSSKNKKAPGPDGIPSEVLKVIARYNPSLLLHMYNTCLRVGIFPSRWKMERLVLISKINGSPELPSSY